VAGQRKRGIIVSILIIRTIFAGCAVMGIVVSSILDITHEAKDVLLSEKIFCISMGSITALFFIGAVIALWIIATFGY
jgi:hypothetical protein